MNDMFIKSEAKKLQFNQKVKQFEIDSIQRENKSYNKDKVNCELCIVFWVVIDSYN